MRQLKTESSPIRRAKVISSVISSRRPQMEAPVGPDKLQAKEGPQEQWPQLHPDRVEVLLRGGVDLSGGESHLLEMDQCVGCCDQRVRSSSSSEPYEAGVQLDGRLQLRYEHDVRHQEENRQQVQQNLGRSTRRVPKEVSFANSKA